ncbi:MAG: histidinol dehydrogenase [Clostridium sp.]|mgnify:CR=1 FL=1|nr:histidinol dehydrogenase [Clostridium sp.]
MIKIIDLRKGKDSDVFEELSSRNQIEHKEVLGKVEKIVENVRSKKDEALLEYTATFDKVTFTADGLRVTEDEIEMAYGEIDNQLIEVIKRARDNIKSFHDKQKEKSWFTFEDKGVILGQVYTALDTVGVYVPGGTAPYPSSVLMNIVPAKVAGVRRVIMCTPPGKDARVNPAILVAAKEAGADEIYKVGGAQAVAALAFGTETIPKVDKIVGPGNIYVAMAKRAVYGYCDIDMIAGPSEIAIIADETANPRFAAADLLSQAEHDAMASSVLVTTSENIAKKVQKQLQIQIETLDRKEIAQKSIRDYGAIIIVDALEDAIGVVNKIAPEHLEICTKAPFDILGDIKNAGAIFLGNYSSEPLGDYFAGPNHVLPTSGTARFFSPLNLSDFVKKSSVISYSKNALRKVWKDVVLFAKSEGLDAHANAIKIRFENEA